MGYETKQYCGSVQKESRRNVLNMVAQLYGRTSRVYQYTWTKRHLSDKRVRNPSINCHEIVTYTLSEPELGGVEEEQKEF